MMRCGRESGDVTVSIDSALGKSALRAELLAARWAMTEPDRQRAHQALRQHLYAALAQLRPATIAAHVPVGTEPLAHDTERLESGRGSPILPELLRDAAAREGRAEPRILLPIWREDNELDWSQYRDSQELTPSRRGLWEPVGPRLGVDEIGRVDLVLVPALAVDRLGQRLGRGAGCYDRSLARGGTTAIAIIYDHEFLAGLPYDGHDVSVSAVLTPSGLRRMH